MAIVDGYFGQMRAHVMEKGYEYGKQTDTHRTRAARMVSKCTPSSHITTYISEALSGMQIADYACGSSTSERISFHDHRCPSNDGMTTFLS